MVYDAELDFITNENMEKIVNAALNEKVPIEVMTTPYSIIIERQ